MECGGIWIDRPKLYTFYIRKAYYLQQKIYKVGFYVMVEDR